MNVKTKWWGRILERLLALVFLFIAILPVYIVVSNAFRRTLDIKRMPPKLIFTPILTHFERVLSVDNFAQYFLNSLIIAGCTTFLVVMMVRWPPMACACSKADWE